LSVDWRLHAGARVRWVCCVASDGHLGGALFTAFEVYLVCKRVFKFLEVLRIDLGVGADELVHLLGHLPFDLELLYVGHLARDGELAEEVAHQDLFDVGLPAEARSRLRDVASDGAGVSQIVFTKAKRLDGVHLFNLLIKLSSGRWSIDY
jgi:hypothetical protein